jgi:hypothetical protein
MRDRRFVAHIDILGMSSIVERDADLAWELLSELVAVRDKTSNYALEFFDTIELIAISDVIQSVTFSDTILLFTKDSSDINLRCLIVLVVEMFHKALSRCVPVRAGISFGTFYFNFEKSMYAGPALIDAYRSGEAAQWLGVTLSRSVQDRAAALNMMTGKSHVVVPWDLPVKDKVNPCQVVTAPSLVVNWPAVVAHDLAVTPPISIEQFYQPFESIFGVIAELPQEVRRKYSNTVEFLNVHIMRHTAA